jgi:hypothetical protein
MKYKYQFIIGVLLIISGLLLGWAVVNFTPVCVPEAHGCPDDIFLLPIFMFFVAGIVALVPIGEEHKRG